MADNTDPAAAAGPGEGEATGAAAAATTEEPPAPPPKEMRCIQLVGFGGIKNVKVRNKPEVTPAEGEVLIRVKACGVNFGDLVIRQGAIDNPPKTPFVLGTELSGEVEALGENTDRFEVGDRVLAFCEYSAWAELVAVPAQFVYKMPEAMTFQDGASIFMNYVTAYILLFDIGALKSGQSLLVHSAGGGVGTAVSQLSKIIGGVTIFGTASPNKHEALKNRVDHVFDHTVDYGQEIRKISPEGVDLVLDSLCGEDTNKGINLLKPLGKYVLFGSSNVVTGETKSFFSFAKSWWQVDKVSPIKLYEENKILAGLNLRQLLLKQNRHEHIRSIITQLFQWYNDGAIKPIVDSAWAFEDIGEAMQKMHDRKNIGKVILDPSMEPKPKEETNAGSKSGSLDKENSLDKKEGEE